ncbi:MAG TPA: hypothetical protein PKE32_01075 [Miltoncostaeaceae bacterium]|nr:hypothetical protein [Miltoncostaeaceae bacterium]
MHADARADDGGHGVLHRLAQTGDARRLTDHGHVGVHDAHARLPHPTHHQAEQQPPGGVGPLRISRRKKRTDVGQPGGGQQRIAQGVGGNVAIGVTVGPLGVLVAHQADHAGAPGGESV